MPIDPVTAALAARLVIAGARVLQAAIDGKKAPDPQRIAALIVRGDAGNQAWDDLFADQTTPQ